MWGGLGGGATPADCVAVRIAGWCVADDEPETDPHALTNYVLSHDPDGRFWLAFVALGSVRLIWQGMFTASGRHAVMRAGRYVAGRARQ